MKLTSYSHACFQLTTQSGTRLITDPWLYSPIYGNMLWQFPQATVPLAEFFDQDAIYISHDHPDHFCEKTLAHFDRRIPVYMRKYPQFVPIRASLANMGFSRIIELDDRQRVWLDETSEMTLLGDPINTDSAIILSDGRHTILNQNDCKLNEDYWRWVGENFSLDLSIQCYGATHLYPAAYEMPVEQKTSEHAKRIEYYLKSAVRTAELIRTPLVLPAANDLAYFSRPDLDPYYVALAAEMAAYARSVNAPFDVILLSPSDVFAFDDLPMNPYFTDRTAFFAELDRVRSSPETLAAAAAIETWERSFTFDSQRFDRLFSQFVSESNIRAMTVERPDRIIEIGLSIESPDSCNQYRISYGPQANTIQHASRPLEQETDLYLVVSVDAHLIEMAMQGAYFFEDLMNCRWRVKRNGGYGRSEVSFWAFLTAFTAYLAERNEQPAVDQRGSLRYLPSPSEQEAVSGR